MIFLYYLQSMTALSTGKWTARMNRWISFFDKCPKMSIVTYWYWIFCCITLYISLIQKKNLKNIYFIKKLPNKNTFCTCVFVYATLRIELLMSFRPVARMPVKRVLYLILFIHICSARRHHLEIKVSIHTCELNYPTPNNKQISYRVVCVWWTNRNLLIIDDIAGM